MNDLELIRGQRFWEVHWYECCISARSDIDLVADTDGDQVPSDGYNDRRAHTTVVTFMHKRVFCPKALVVNWHKPRGKKVLEHMAHGRVLWLDAMTHEGERISIINIHQATARRPDLQNAWILTFRQKWISQKGGEESWEETWMRQRRVQNIPSRQSLTLRK